MTTDVQWTEPPQKRTGSGGGPGRPPHYTDVADALRQRPGEWAVVQHPNTARAGYTLAYRIRSGRLAAFRPGGTFDASCKTAGPELEVVAAYRGNGAP